MDRLALTLSFRPWAQLLPMRGAALGIIVWAASAAHGIIPKPRDAPQPLSPEASRQAFVLPEGYRISLLAAEPLITEPSGICWDERGRCFVCELHGYNLEGQLEIDELNRSGALDLEVRRVQASEANKKRAEAETYGTVKLLRDRDGDGRMDDAVIWADRLPPCHGIAAGNGGVIVACSTRIVFLADRDGDDRPEVKEDLFSGFGQAILERSINSPTWSPDGWLYFGRGQHGGRISGPHLKTPVELPASDFRIRADGSAIEPVGGSTKTMGMTFTATGERFVCTTTHAGLQVTPLSWSALQANADAPSPALDQPACEDARVYPLAKPHPWRVRREEHAEYFAFYRKISLSDAAASGYFTSACSNLIWRGEYFVCEPAQNLVHRARLKREGTSWSLERLPQESQGEFLASRDSWFHPVALTQTPTGDMAIVDFYREIIEDYSAIPRHLQQQYGLLNGRDRGRIWVLRAAGEWQAPPLSEDEKQLLQLRRGGDVHAVDWKRELSAPLALELASGLGPKREALLSLARRYGHLRWMDAAIACSARGLEQELMLDLARDPGRGEAVQFHLAGIVAGRGDLVAIQQSLQRMPKGRSADLLRQSLEELRAPRVAAPPMALPEPPKAVEIAKWEKRMPAVLAALEKPADAGRGREVFAGLCAACHRSHGLGASVGPDLDAEFQRAPQTIVRDILFPSEAARPGYDSVHVQTRRGENLLGIVTSESPTSLTLALAGGAQRTVLRKHAQVRRLRQVSLMPAGLGEVLQPGQIADLIAFLRSAPTSR
jgi:putative membrane-bound dehydrogenase-like protein